MEKFCPIFLYIQLGYAKKNQSLQSKIVAINSKISGCGDMPSNKNLLKNSFSQRELDVLTCIMNGHSYKGVALILRISDRTVEAHVKNIFVKMGVTTKEEAIKFLKKNNRLPLIKEREITNGSNDFKEDVPIIYHLNKSTYLLKIIGSISLCLVIFVVCKFHETKIPKIVLNGMVVSNATYVDRKNIINQLKVALDNTANAIALVGHGGAGKTTLARKHLQNSGYDFAYEINAETMLSAGMSVKSLAHSLACTEIQRQNLQYILNIQGSMEREKQLLLFIKSCLCEMGDWCLLFDNVEDFDVLKRFCFSDSQGKIIITSRNEEIQNVNYLGKMSCVVVDELTEDEKYQLFCFIINNNKWNVNEVQKFLKQLPSFPLDVSSAAYYIKNVKVTLQEYDDLLKAMENDFLEKGDTFVNRYNDYDRTRYGIVTSTFKNIMMQNEKFKEILFSICFLDSQKIPIQIMRNIFGTKLVNELLFDLEKYFMISTQKDTVSIHRKIQRMGLQYLSQSFDDCNAEKILSHLSSYEYLDHNYTDIKRLIPHLKMALANLDEVKLDNGKKKKFQIGLLVTIGYIYRFKEQTIDESIPYLEKALRLNNEYKLLSKHEAASVMIVLGELRILLNHNDKAEEILNESCRELKSSSSNSAQITDHANNLRLLGILRMRRNKFDAANACFDDAINELERNNCSEVFSLVTKARTYAAKSTNYVNQYINKDGMSDAIDLIKTAINILEEKSKENLASFEHDMIMREIVDFKTTLSGMENAVMHHDVALKLAEEAENLLHQLPDEDNRSYCSFGKICTEKGHAYLRMNQLKKAKEMFEQARKVCDKAHVNEYVWRTRMQQTETLVRLGELDEAYENCVFMFNEKDRDRNIGTDLFYNTSYYHAAIIKHRQGDVAQSLKYFEKFFALMLEFCKDFIDKESYEKMVNRKIFETNLSELEIKKYYENALKIFSAVCKKGSGFITDYVEQNLATL
jgi:DNA-binding CsgD family transcriptional regulator/tetratricopeptide (TPR) repeat protein